MDFCLLQPKGRAIQVEDSAGERQPSMDVRRSRTRDCEVIQVCCQFEFFLILMKQKSASSIV